MFGSLWCKAVAPWLPAMICVPVNLSATLQPGCVQHRKVAIVTAYGVEPETFVIVSGRRVVYRGNYNGATVVAVVPLRGGMNLRLVDSTGHVLASGRFQEGAC